MGDNEFGFTHKSNVNKAQSYIDKTMTIDMDNVYHIEIVDGRLNISYRELAQLLNEWYNVMFN